MRQQIYFQIKNYKALETKGPNQDKPNPAATGVAAPKTNTTKHGTKNPKKQIKNHVYYLLMLTFVG